MAELVLGIETSCDETSAAVLSVQDGRASLRSLVILSQDVHRIFGGVVPELASRAHLRTVAPVVEQALAEAGISREDITGIAATAGPGLIGPLLVFLGVAFGQKMDLAFRRMEVASIALSVAVGTSVRRDAEWTWREGGFLLLAWA